jgi:hypothetical protein
MNRTPLDPNDLNESPESLAGYFLLCNGVAQSGDLYVEGGTIAWARYDWPTNADGYVENSRARIYRKGNPPRHEGQTITAPAEHYSAPGPRDTETRATLPTDAAVRKGLPIVTGVLDYFPDALAEVARASLAGNKQHLAGKPLHWDKSKSTDEADALGRHLMERGTIDTDGVRHSAKVAWRALALLQREIDAERAAK